MQCVGLTNLSGCILAIPVIRIMFVMDSRFFCCYNIRRLKGNAGEMLIYSGAVPATVIHILLLTINRHCITRLIGIEWEGVSKVKSQETCREILITIF